MKAISISLARCTRQIPIIHCCLSVTASLTSHSAACFLSKKNRDSFQLNNDQPPEEQFSRPDDRTTKLPTHNHGSPSTRRRRFLVVTYNTGIKKTHELHQEELLDTLLT